MTLLEVHRIAKRFGRTAAITDANFTVRRGEIVALLGPNGAGKTTLLDGVAGLQAMDTGTVMCDGAAMSHAQRAATIFCLPDGIAPWSAQPADWLRTFAADMFGYDTRIAADVTDTLRLDELGSQPIGTLSKGQCKRLLLSTALLSSRPIVVLDEPFDGLDLRMTRATIALLRRAAALGRAFVIAIHAMSDAERVADRLVLLSDGRTIGDGTLEQLRARASLPGASLEEVFLALS